MPGPSRCKDSEPLEQEGTSEHGKSNINRMISKCSSCSCHDVNDTDSLKGSSRRSQGGKSKPKIRKRQTHHCKRHFTDNEIKSGSLHR